MSTIHIIGDQDTVLGYRFAGVAGDVVETADEARRAFEAALQAPDAGILLITEQVDSFLQDAVTAHKVKAIPPYIAVVEDIWGRREQRRSLQDMIYEAVGIRLAADK